MQDTFTPASPGGTDTAAPQVTTPSAEPDTPPAVEPGGHPQADKPAGQVPEQTDAAAGEDGQPPEQPKTGKEKRQERNRARWQEYKANNAVVPQRLAAIEREVAQLRGVAKPDFSRINDPAEAIAKQTAWEVRQELTAGREEHLKTERQQAAADQERSMHRAWDESKAEARERLPDFDKVFTDDVPIHPRAAPHIVESDKGADIAYWLGKNPVAARDLAEKFETAPAQALIELGRIEARLSAPPAKQVSTAPKPASVLSGGASPSGFDPSKASVADFAADLKKRGYIR